MEVIVREMACALLCSILIVYKSNAIGHDKSGDEPKQSLQTVRVPSTYGRYGVQCGKCFSDMNVRVLRE